MPSTQNRHVSVETLQKMGISVHDIRGHMSVYDWGAPAMITVRDVFNPTGDVLYPYCYTHTTPARILGKDRTLHVDSNPKAIAALQAEGFRGVVADVRTVVLDQEFGAMVLLQPDLGAAHVIAHLAKRGYVITNMGDQIAEELLYRNGDGRFVLLGYIAMRTGHLSTNVEKLLRVVLPTSNEEYLQRVSTLGAETAEQLKSYQPTQAIQRSGLSLRDFLILRKE